MLFILTTKMKMMEQWGWRWEGKLHRQSTRPLLAYGPFFGISKVKRLTAWPLNPKMPSRLNTITSLKVEGSAGNFVFFLSFWLLNQGSPPCSFSLHPSISGCSSRHEAEHQVKRKTTNIFKYTKQVLLREQHCSQRWLLFALCYHQSAVLAFWGVTCWRLYDQDYQVCGKTHKIKVCWCFRWNVFLALAIIYWPYLLFCLYYLCSM